MLNLYFRSIEELTQDFSFNYQVGVGRDWTLYALAEGYVKYKSGLLQPYAWGYGKQDKFHEKKFIHIVQKQPFTGPKLVPANDVYRISER